MKPYAKPTIRERLTAFPRMVYGRLYSKPSIREGGHRPPMDLHVKELHGGFCEGDDPYGFDGGWRLQEYYREQEDARRRGWDLL